MSGLVFIGKIAKVEAIEGADRIVLATAVCGRGGKWLGCIQKDSMVEGDPCQVYLQDAIVPQTPDLAFMEKHKWRVKMCRFKGVPSECLIMPQTLGGWIGDDVTADAGVTKFEKPIPWDFKAQIAGTFPQFIPKTDEVNFQSVPDMVDALRGLAWHATVKYDGTSTTLYRRGDHLGLCSRNYEIKPGDDNVMWQITKRYGLHDSLPAGLALQWETIGPGIQGNPLGLVKADMRLFNVYDIDSGLYLDPSGVVDIAEKLSVPFVDWIPGLPEPFGMNAEQLRKLAEGTYPNGRQREGIVIRPLQGRTVVIDHTPMRLSFKVINLLYKDVT